MHHIAHSWLLQDYDRPAPAPVPTTSAVRAAVAKSLKNCHSTKLEHCSIPEDKFVEIGSPAFSGLSPEGFREQGMVTAMLLQLARSWWA